MKVTDKIISATDGIKVKRFNINQTPSAAPKASYLKEKKNKIKTYSTYITNTLIERQLQVEIL